MKVVLRSSSLLFTILSIVLDAPIRRRAELRPSEEPLRKQPGRETAADPLRSKRTFHLFPQARG
jgi:hypothetical protein